MKSGLSVRGVLQVLDTASLPARGAFYPCNRVVRAWCRRILVLAVLAAAAVYELRTSTLEAWLLARVSQQLSFDLGSGPSPRAVFPQTGPYDERHGYSRIPEFQSLLLKQDFQIAEQARLSPGLSRMMRWGIAPPYREPAFARLTIRGAHGELLFQAGSEMRSFSDFTEVPPLLVKTLLFLENQRLDNWVGRYANPVIDWERLAKAALLYAGSKLGLADSVQGGSTLATQIEKFRHSPEGRTQSIFDKARQLIGASLKAYRDGADTRPRRQEIVVDYLNSMPLSATPAYGEVNGIGEGLYAWFGLQPDEVWRALRTAEATRAKAAAYKHALALLVSLPAPTNFLLRDRDALGRRVDAYTRILERAGVIDAKFADLLRNEGLRFSPGRPKSHFSSFTAEKATYGLRVDLLQRLGVRDLYSLDRLHLEAESTIDSDLQAKVTRLFHSMTDPEFVRAHGLNQEQLLLGADSRKVMYSLLLFEQTPRGNLLRVQADNLNGPFDLSTGMKLELGSTAKLRTLAHYLEVIAVLHRELAQDDSPLTQRAINARDPITQWVAARLMKQRDLGLDRLLEDALERRYSASPYEGFFTGGGLHSFTNFDFDDNGRIFSVREAFQRSINLVFIRLMRDLVRFHEARLAYDGAAVLTDLDHPKRAQFLTESVEEEARIILHRAYENYRGLPAEAIVQRLLGSRAQSPRHHAILFFAWNKGGDEAGLADWLERYHSVAAVDIPRLYRAYSNPRLNLADYGYLLSIHPLQVWCAGEVARNPQIGWDELLRRSDDARATSYGWLYSPRHRKAQDLRLRIRIEKDAFERMTPYWQRLGFPFERLVPSYATSIGTSSDRPSALADLMGMIVNDGLRRPALSLTKLHFAHDTPYETVLQPNFASAERVMRPEVARTLKGVLAQVVESGTAGRLRGAFLKSDGLPLRVGGKTGSGDNRYKRFNRYGQQTSSRVVSRTATFVFYIGDRYYGVITTLVPGRQAGGFSFTSALPVTVMKMLAPTINARLKENSEQPENSSSSPVARIKLPRPGDAGYRTILMRLDRTDIDKTGMARQYVSASRPWNCSTSMSLPESRIVLWTPAPLVRAPPT